MRFAIGELARLVVAGGNRSFAHLGEVVEVVRWNVENYQGHKFDYGTVAQDGMKIAVMDYQLQKLEPPKEPESMVNVTELESQT